MLQNEMFKAFDVKQREKSTNTGTLEQGENKC